MTTAEKNKETTRLRGRVTRLQNRLNAGVTLADKIELNRQREAAKKELEAHLRTPAFD